MTCGEVFVTRTSDSNFALNPSACATPRTINASGGGPDFGVSVTGVAMLIEIGTFVDPPPVGVTRPVGGELKSIVTPPMLVPSDRPFVVATALRVVPPEPTTPEDGVTEIHGRVGV